MPGGWGGGGIEVCQCRCEGYGFQAFYSGIGCINQRVWVQNRVSFSSKLINWLKILVFNCKLGKPGIATQEHRKKNQIGMVFWLDCASDLSIFQKTATLEYGEFGEFSLVQGSKIQLNQLWFSIPAEHPHPKIPEVSLRVRTGLQFEFQNLKFRALRKKPCRCRYFTTLFALSLLLSQVQFVFGSFSVSPFPLSHVAVSRPCRMSEFNSNRAWMVEMMKAA